MKRIIGLAAVFAAGAVLAAEPAAKATVTVDFAQELGAIKLMHGVNNGPAVAPVGGDQKRGNFREYKAARLPFARTHDAINCVSGGAHTCDIDAVFPDFDADENDPKNYDFVFTDLYLDCIRRAGTEVFFRLGQTIEHGPKKYGVLPPKDYAKWARIAEHVIRHYNEGWGWGVDKAWTTRNIAFSNQFNIVRWEIWNEPDLDASDGELPRNPRCWGGTVTNFFQFYETAAKHLKAKFPQLKIGGPALAGRVDWAKRFITYCRDNDVPLDFFSWHIYSRTPEPVAGLAVQMRRLLDSHGFEKTESILNEWNYVKGWGDDWVYSLRVESGDLNLKSAAYVAGTMAACQNAPVDILMYYDARSSTAMNGMFERVTLWPLKGYYPFIAWGKLVDRGTQVACTVTEGTGKDAGAVTGNVERKDKSAKGAFRAVAAKGKDGSGALLIVRYSDDDNVSDTGTVTIRVPGRSLAGAKCHLTDLVRTYTEVPLEVAADGSATLQMLPFGFALVEF